MVYNCCVNGCSNRSSNLRKNGSPVSFFAFPTNRVQRLKWLHAIGKPNWDPPATARVCCTHFRDDQLVDINSTLRIPDHVVPDRGLSPMVDLGVSNKQVCRICLATNVKTYSTSSGYLYTCISGIVGFNDTIKGLPQCVCYECAALLVKSYKLVEKSNLVQTTLLDLFTRHGSITYSIIKKLDRTALNLKSYLQEDKNVTETFEYVNDDEDDTPLVFMKRDPFGAPKKEPPSKSEDYKDDNQCKIEEAYVPEVMDMKADSDVDNNHNENDDIEIENDNHFENEEITNNYEHVENTDEESSHDIKYSNLDKTVLEEPSFVSKANGKKLFNLEDGRRKRNKNKAKCVGADGLTEDERELQKYFKIVKLTLEEQIEDFKKAQKSKSRDFVLECDVCTRMFTNTTLLTRHMGVHDSSRGEAECPVCKHRYRNQGLVNAHSANAHGTRFICNACPKVFRNIGMARKHQLEHAGLVYQCPHCAFTTAFEASLGVHSRYLHAGCRCGRCTRTFIPDTPGKQETNDKEKPAVGVFKENRLRKCKKRKKPTECVRKPRNPDLLTTCKLCGASCPSVAELKAHRRKEHAGQYKNKKTWLMPGDSYPTKCEHCSTMLSCRKEHWAHVRRSHPDEKASYRSVITAVCELCGQGFQNTGRLRLHELRHGQPTVPCELCNKMFYDKFLLAIHMETHSDARPYRCQTCGKGFKTRSNLDKHHRTHSDVAAYTCKLCGKKFKYSTSMNLHIRTVHHKIPLPPRKRKSRKSAAENT